MQNTEDSNKPIFIKMLGDKTVLAEIIMLLADIRHILNKNDTETLTVTINKKHNGKPILFTVNNQEIEDYKPADTHYIN